MEELGFSEEEIPMLARIAYEDPQTVGNPREVTVADYEEIYRGAFAKGEVMHTQTRDYAMYVAGEWTGGGADTRIEATSPATGEVIGTVPDGNREDARRAIAAAGAAGRRGRPARRSSEPPRWRG